METIIRVLILIFAVIASYYLFMATCFLLKKLLEGKEKEEKEKYSYTTEDFTKREFEVMYLLSIGYEDPEIIQRINEKGFHKGTLMVLKEKLLERTGARNLCHLIALMKDNKVL